MTTSGPVPAGEPDLVAVGRIGPAHGVAGDTLVAPATDDPADRFRVGTALRTDSPARPWLTVERMSLQSGRLVVRFAGVDDRAAAEELRGTVLYVVASERPALTDPDEFYDTDLVGLRALDPSGADLGTVAAVVHGGAHDLLELRRDDRSYLVPFVAAIVPSVDLSAGVVVVDAPEGLFDL